MSNPIESIDLGFGKKIEVIHHYDCNPPYSPKHTVTHYLNINTDIKQIINDRFERIDKQLEDLQNHAFLRRTKKQIQNIRNQINELKKFAN